MTAVIVPLPAYTDSSGSSEPSCCLPKILTGPVPQCNTEANSNDSQLVILNLRPADYFRVPFVRAHWPARPVEIVSFPSRMCLLALLTCWNLSPVLSPYVPISPAHMLKTNALSSRACDWPCLRGWNRCIPLMCMPIAPAPHVMAVSFPSRACPLALNTCSRLFSVPSPACPSALLRSQDCFIAFMRVAGRVGMGVSYLRNAVLQLMVVCMLWKWVTNVYPYYFLTGEGSSELLSCSSL